MSTLTEADIAHIDRGGFLSPEIVSELCRLALLGMKVEARAAHDAMERDRENAFNMRVEAEARRLYDALPFDGPGEKPAWVPGGNSIKQDDCRRKARQTLEAHS